MNIRNVNRLANKYYDGFSDRVNQNKEFIRSIDELVELEYQRGEFDHASHLLQLKPDTKVSWLDKMIGVMENYHKDYKKHYDDKYYNEKQVYISTTLQSYLANYKPSNFETTEECIAYEIFLSKVSSRYLVANNPNAIDYSKLEARFKTNIVNTANLQDGIKMLEDYHKKTHESLETLSLQNKTFYQGQQQCNQLLNKVDKNIEKYSVKLDKVEKNIEKDSVKLDKVEKQLTAFGIKVEGDLKQLLKDNQVIRGQLDYVCGYVSNLSAQKQYEEKIDGVMSAAGFVTELGKYLGNKDICRIGVLAQSGIKITTCLAALQGPLSLASLNPIMGIGMAALSVAGAFANQGPDMNQRILDAIRSISSQLSDLRREMHERFDQIESRLIDIHLLVISGFCDMRSQHKNIITLLRDIRDEILKENRDIDRSFAMLNRKVNQIGDMQFAIGRREKIEKLNTAINRVMGTHKLGPTTFVDLYNYLKTELCEHHSTDPLFVGRKISDPSSVVDYLENELENKNCFAHEFNINILKEYFSILGDKENNLINPVIWSWITMGFMELIKGFYEKKENPSRSISKAEVKDLEKIAEVGKATIRFSNALKDTGLLLQLHQRFIAAGRALGGELKNYVLENETKTTKKLDCDFAQRIDKTAEFKEQIIPLDVRACSSWFVGKVYNYHPNFPNGRIQTSGTLGLNDTYVSDKVKTYVDARQKSINDIKISYVETIRKRFVNQMGELHYFSPSAILAHYNYSFAMPYNEGDPILPLPLNFKLPIPSKLQLAEWLGIGRIEFQYRILKRADNTMNFVLSSTYIMNDQRYAISTATVPYQPGVYTNANFSREAIWWFWVGGDYCKDGAAPDSLVNSNPTSEGNTWKTFVPVPACQENQGQYANLANAKVDILVSDNSELVNTVKQKILEGDLDHKKILLNDIEKVSRQQDSKLGQAFIKYSHAFYILKTALAIAYDEVNLKQFSELSYLYDETMTSSRNQFLKLFMNEIDNKRQVPLINLFHANLEQMETQFPIGLNKLSTSPLLDSCLSFALKELDNLITWYKPRAVDENELCTSIAIEKMQKTRLEHNEVIFKIFRKAVLSCDSDVQAKLSEALQHQSAGMGISFSSGLGLLQFSGAGKEKGAPNNNPYGLFAPSIPIPNSWADGDKIMELLETQLKDSAHIINPNLGSTDNLNLFSSDPINAQEAAAGYGKLINGFIPKDDNIERKTVSNGFVQSDGGSLKKPIVSILNIGSAKARHGVDAEAIGGSHWVALVILPKNYKNLSNADERIFLLDSLDPDRAFPPSFHQVLTKGINHIFSSPAAEHKNAPEIVWTHEVIAPFPKAEFVISSACGYKKQQVGYSDCGWWAVDNVLKLLETGSLSNIMKDYEKPRRADHLRKIYPSIEESNMGRIKNKI